MSDPAALYWSARVKEMEAEISRLRAKNARLSDLLDEGFTIVNDHLQHSYDIWLTKVIEEKEDVDAP
jgi:hypothetical protein